MDYNYFEVLELSIDDIQDKDEATIKDLVSNAHTKQYAQTIGGVCECTAFRWLNPSAVAESAQ